MQITAYKTHKITPKESLFAILDKYLPSIPDQNIVVITSKIISFCQNRIIPKANIPNKLELIRKEAEFYLDEKYKQYGVYLTIKNKILIPTAGIDESNGNDYYILYPEDLPGNAVEIWKYLKKRAPGQSVGVIITDSHTTPTRRGVIGIALAWCGFEPLFTYIGKPDLFGRPLKITKINLLDSLAASAVLVMGEGDEQTPLSIISNAPKIIFQDRPPSEEEMKSTTIALDEDLYAPLLTHVNWKKGG